MQIQFNWELDWKENTIGISQCTLEYEGDIRKECGPDFIIHKRHVNNRCSFNNNLFKYNPQPVKGYIEVSTSQT